MPATKGYLSLEQVCSCLKKPRGAGWEPGSTILLPPKAACFFLSLSIGKLIPLHAKWKLHFNCLFGSFSILLLFFPNYITILSAPFPLCLSRLKGWTHGTHWPLQLTWARNTKSIYLLSSLPHYFSFMKSKPWRNVSHTFTWSVWHTQGSSLKTELHNNYLWCVHPANLSLHYTSTPPLQFMFQSHSTYAFCYLFSGQHL